MFLMSDVVLEIILTYGCKEFVATACELPIFSAPRTHAKIKFTHSCLSYVYAALSVYGCAILAN